LKRILERIAMLEQLIVNVNRIEKSFDVCTFERNDVVQLATRVQAGWNFALADGTLRFSRGIRDCVRFRLCAVCYRERKIIYYQVQ
jgi:hypothetical protein